MTGRWPSADKMHGARTSCAAARVALLRTAESSYRRPSDEAA